MRAIDFVLVLSLALALVLLDTALALVLLDTALALVLDTALALVLCARLVSWYHTVFSHR